MLTIDRSAPASVFEQLLEQLRYELVSGRWQVDDVLPSTRVLAEQVGVSFHTVRKAYQALEGEGLLTSKVGSGYRVKERTPLEKAERLERGARVMEDALKKLVGLGLSETEIAHLFDEQVDMVEHPTPTMKVVLVGAYREEAEALATDAERALQMPVLAATPADLATQRDADYVLAPFPTLPHALETLPLADALGVLLHPPPEVLDRIARLLPSQTIGLVTRDADAIAPIMNALREATGFAGQILAAPADAGVEHLQKLFREIALLVCTPRSRRRIGPLLEQHRHLTFRRQLAPASLRLIRETIPV